MPLGRSAGGLETPLFTFLLTAATLAFVREEERNSGWWSGLLFGLLAMARPEGSAFAALAAATRFLRIIRRQATAQRGDLVRLACLAGIVVPYFVWRISYYGHLFPNTIYAKSMGFHPRGIMEGIYYLYNALTMGGGLALLLIPMFFAWSAKPRPFFCTYVVATLLAFVAFIIAGGGDWMALQRFTVHVFPLALLLVHAGIHELLGWWTYPRARAVALLLLAGQMGYFAMSSLEQRLVNRKGAIPIGPNVPRVTDYMRERLKGEGPIALLDAGLPAYLMPLTVRVVDIVGLVDGHIAHLPPKFPHGLLGRGDAFGKWDTDYVLAQEPQFVQVGRLERGEDGRWKAGFSGAEDLINDPRFVSRYRLVDRPGFQGIFERRSDAENP